MSAEHSKFIEATKGVVIGVGIILLAVSCANVALLNLGILMSSGV